VDSQGDKGEEKNWSGVAACGEGSERWFGEEGRQDCWLAAAGRDTTAGDWRTMEGSGSSAQAGLEELIGEKRCAR